MQERVGHYQLFEGVNKQVILNMVDAEYQTGDNVKDYPHCHQQMEVLLVTGGFGQIRLSGDKCLEAREGDVFVFDSMQQHKPVSDGRQPLQVRSLLFDIRSFIREEYNVFSRQVLDTFFIKLYSMQNRIPGDSKCAARIRLMFGQMEEIFAEMSEGTDEGAGYVLRTQLLVVYSLLIQYYEQHYMQTKASRTEHYAEIERAMVYINQHLQEEITLEELSQIAGMSKTYFSTIFKKVTGVTVWDYITNIRVERAVSYLVTKREKYNISEISELCGFHNAANFNKTFKKKTGMTPSEYKKTKYNSCFSE